MNKKLYRVQHVYDYINIEFGEVYTATQNLVAEDRLMLWKESLGTINFICMKWARFSIDIYSVLI